MKETNEYYMRYRKNVMLDEESLTILNKARNKSRLVREALKLIGKESQTNNLLYLKAFK